MWLLGSWKTQADAVQGTLDQKRACNIKAPVPAGDILKEAAGYSEGPAFVLLAAAEAIKEQSLCCH